MIYLNSAATSYPKPACVVDAYLQSVNALPSAQFRSAGIFDNGDLFGQTKEGLGKILGISDTDCIHFASGSTDGLNRIIFGLPYEANQYITTATEHNSVLRPLFNLTPGQEPAIAPCNEEGVVSIEALKSTYTSRAKVLIVNHCSNVTGAVQDLQAIGEFARKHQLIFMVDVSQSAGCMEIKADEWGIDALAFTGHKSLLGLQGTGGYYVKKGLELKPLLYGGTGKDSSRIHYEGDYEYEVGTQNSNGIAALNVACQYLLAKGIASIHEKENDLGQYLLSALDGVNHIKIYGRNLKGRGPVVSLGIDNMAPSDVAYILQSSYNIITRAGLQCAPLIHDYIGSGKQGTLRISYSDMTKLEELDSLVAALKDIAQAANG